MNYTIINRKTNFKPNQVQRINEEKTNIASISKKINKDLLEVSPLLHERLRTYSDKIDFDRVVINCLDIIKEKDMKLTRLKRLEAMKANAGFTLITVIIVFGIIGISLITFLIIKGILH